MTRRERPTSWGAHYDEADNEPEPRSLVGHGSTTPSDFFEALMQCAPGDEPDRTIADLLPLREVLNDALAQLSEQEQWIFDALIVRRLSVRQLAKEIAMPKSTVHRWVQRAQARMAQILEDNPTVKEYLR